ncbi:MAG: hypothetical protein HFJ25_04025 [Clostridia bacterium]|jgi:hypothetical protein|nr:hypothetical protein [Clostridia bacterium]
MDRLDKKIKKVLTEQKISDKYEKMIEDTMKIIAEDKETVNMKQNRKSKFLKFIQAIAAMIVVGILGITTYAAVNRKIKY